KGAAKTAKVTAQTKSVELKVASAYTDLGKQTFHSHAEASGPEAVVRPVMDALARLESLDAEIAVLSEKGSGSWITPKRLAVGGIATAAIILVIIGSSFFGGGDAAFRRELAGEWHSDNGVVVTFDAHEVVASDGKANFKSVYSTNRSRRTASFRSPDGVD